VIKSRARIAIPGSDKLGIILPIGRFRSTSIPEGRSSVVVGGSGTMCAVEIWRGNGINPGEG
jgi:hypothetical protein